MKINIAYPVTGRQKLIDFDEEKFVKPFYEKRMGTELDISFLGEQFEGYVAKITGGNDKQGFPMKEGVIVPHRVRLLLSKGHSCYRPRRDGERKRKSVRGCIIDGNIAVLSIIIKKKGKNEIEGLTDNALPRRLGPKRASKIRKMFNLSKEDDPCRYVIRRPLAATEKRPARTKAPKIQRLITPRVLQHRAFKKNAKAARKEKSANDKAEYQKLLRFRAREAAKRKLSSQRRSSMRKSSTSSAEADNAAYKEVKKQSKAKKEVIKAQQQKTQVKQTSVKGKQTKVEPVKAVKGGKAAPKKPVAAAAPPKAKKATKGKK